MALSVFDLFKIGIGPSSSHTVGPMRAARQFAIRLRESGMLGRVARIAVTLYGSLGATGKGHGSDKAILLGLSGHEPDTVDVNAIAGIVEGIRSTQRFTVLGEREIAFNERTDLTFNHKDTLPLHSNGMRFTAFDAGGARAGRTGLTTRWAAASSSATNRRREAARKSASCPISRNCPCRFAAATSCWCCAIARTLPIAGIMRRNERAWRSDAEIDAGLLKIWNVMQACVKRGCETPGVLPGGYKVKRRAPELYRQLTAPQMAAPHDPLIALDWVNLWALAVNEENAAGGRVVTAPTNGAAGIVPALMHYYARFVHGANDAGIVDFLLTAAAIGFLYKENASISGAEVGCQGEVGRGLLDGGGGADRSAGRHAARRWRTPPRSRWNITSGSPAIRSAGWCRFPASNAMPSARPKPSTWRAWRCAATARTTFPSTRSSRPCARPAPT